LIGNYNTVIQIGDDTTKIVFKTPEPPAIYTYDTTGAMDTGSYIATLNDIANIDTFVPIASPDGVNTIMNQDGMLTMGSVQEKIIFKDNDRPELASYTSGGVYVDMSPIATLDDIPQPVPPLTTGQEAILNQMTYDSDNDTIIVDGNVDASEIIAEGITLGGSTITSWDEIAGGAVAGDGLTAAQLAVLSKMNYVNLIIPIVEEAWMLFDVSDDDTHAFARLQYFPDSIYSVIVDGSSMTEPWELQPDQSSPYYDVPTDIGLIGFSKFRISSISRGEIGGNDRLDFEFSNGSYLGAEQTWEIIFKTGFAYKIQALRQGLNITAQIFTEHDITVVDGEISATAFSLDNKSIGTWGDIAEYLDLPNIVGGPEASNNLPFVSCTEADTIVNSPLTVNGNVTGIIKI
jgi:hypothetical protein